MANSPQGFYYSSHYAQAYAQANASAIQWHTQGAPVHHYNHYNIPQPSSSTAFTSAFQEQQFGVAKRPLLPQGPWYQPGNVSCAYEGCSFLGSKKAVEIHRMDRHLIYPPWWDKRKRTDDWDADLSLKGKPLPIQGTNLRLDTPEAIDSWIAERRKRWPSAGRVQEREQKRDEAIARGQIQDPLSRPQKKRRIDDNNSFEQGRGSGGHRGADSRGRGRGRGRGGIAGQGGAGIARTPIPLPPKPQTALMPSGSESISDSDSNSDSDMDPEKDAVSSKKVSHTVNVESGIPSIEPLQSEMQGREEDAVSEREQDQNLDSIISPSTEPEPSKSKVTVQSQNHPRHRPQPRPPPHNPFDRNRNSLLRNILLPEIRMTISNFSQALHFLVENDFLEDVELKPGGATEQAIKIID